MAKRKLNIVTDGKPIDLNTCKEGDLLISHYGLVLTYVRKRNDDKPYPHLVRYPDGSHGTRCDNGKTYINRSLPEDHDIVSIVHL